MFICLNGSFFLTNSPAIFSANSSYRYGDGLFETIRYKEGELLLLPLHFDRLWRGLQLLNYALPSFFSRDLLEKKIRELLKKNNIGAHARIRLSVYRGEGGLYDNNNKTGYLIECWPLEAPAFPWNENGLVLGVYPDARKPIDLFSNLKSSSFLIYSMAAQYAKQHRWNDAIVLNTNGAIADTTIATIFLVKEEIVYTPSLNEGGVAGVMRSYLLEAFQKQKIEVREASVHLSQLQEADEVFLTNAIRGIRWVQRIGDTLYKNNFSRQLYERILLHGEL